MKPNYRPWTPEADKVLRLLHAAGESFGAIGETMGRSRHSCLGRAHRLDLARRANPVTYTGPAKPRAPKPTPLPAAVPAIPAVRTAAGPCVGLSSLTSPPAPVVVPAAPFAGRPIPQARACQWPMWGDQAPIPRPPLYCGAALARVCPPYCRQHAAIAFARPKVAA